MNGASGGLETGYLYDMKSFEEVKEAWRAQFNYFHKWSVTMQNYCEYMTIWHCPNAALSISLEGCMETGQDCGSGGCKYNSYGGTATGLATIADSLTTIKYMCFDKKLCTTRSFTTPSWPTGRATKSCGKRSWQKCPTTGTPTPMRTNR
jgi:formate C-acetyltransferase